MRAGAGVRAAKRNPLAPESRYELLLKIASGGMASVYLGRLKGAAGFSRLVAIKRAHAHLLEDSSFTRALIAEAKMASRIHHPHVVTVLDVEEVDGEIILVMDYVEGVAVSELVRAERELTLSLTLRIALDACAGLAAVHAATDEAGKPLHVVHRDVSPHNLLVGVDGLTKVADLGIAKSFVDSGGGRTETGARKGKIGYMAPEYLSTGKLDQRADIFSLSVVIWEMLTGRRLFTGANEVDMLRSVLEHVVPPPSSVAPGSVRALDAPVLKGLARSPENRFATVRELAEALSEAAQGLVDLATPAQLGDHVRAVAGEALDERRHLVATNRDVGANADDVERAAAVARRSGTTRAFSSEEADSAMEDAATLRTTPAILSTEVVSTDGAKDDGASTDGTNTDAAHVDAADAENGAASGTVLVPGDTAPSFRRRGRRALMMVVLAGALALGLVLVFALRRSAPASGPDIDAVRVLASGADPSEGTPSTTADEPSASAPTVAAPVASGASSAADTSLADREPAGAPSTEGLSRSHAPSGAARHGRTPPRHDAPSRPTSTALGPVKAPANPY